MLIIVDSSSSEYESVNKLAEKMNIIILDHHNVEESDIEMNAILVNPNQDGCNYPNKDISGAGVTYRFIELLDYHYKKVDVRKYLDLVATSLLSDQMDVRNLENRYFIKQGLSTINNVGLLALIKASKNDENKVDSQVMNFSVIPILNTVTRNNEMSKAFSLLFEKDYFKALKKAKYLLDENKLRKEKVKELFEEYKQLADVGKFALVTSPEASKNYNGLFAQKMSSDYKRPSLVLKDNGDTYQGSGRSYAGFDLQGFLKECPYVNYAAGHSEALGVGIDKKNWDKFKQYVNDNIDEKLFEPVIEYDIELTEEQLDWDLVNEIEELDQFWGNNSPKITVKLTDVFVEDKELFPKGKEEHLKIKTDKMDIMKFYDKDYAGDVDSWDDISVIGSVGVNEWRGERRIQFYVEDYIKN